MGKILNLEQRSQAWYDWRNGLDLPDHAPRVMASEIAVIMGVSPFRTIHELWLEKTGQVAPQASNFAMEHGVRNEDGARLQYQAEYGEHVIPTCVEHETYPQFGASLDGLSILGDVLTEIKCPISEKSHREAVEGRVPAHYMPQVLWQLFVSGADIGHFYSWFKGDGKRVIVMPDQAQVDLMVEAALEFRRCVIERVAPAGEVFVEAAHTWRRAKRIAEEIEATLAEAKATLAERETVLISMLGDRDKIQGGGVTVTRFDKKGSVDYAKMVKDMKIDESVVESYRKAGSSNNFRVTETDKAPVPEPVIQKSTASVPEGELSF